MNGFDHLGLACENCCDKAGLENDPAIVARGGFPGGTGVCCGGKLYLCTWGGGDLYEKWRGFRDKKGLEKGALAINDCIEKHERGHGDRGEFEPCDASKGDAPYIAKWKTGITVEQAEKIEFKARAKEMECLKKKFDACKGDPACQKTIRERASGLAGQNGIPSSKSPRHQWKVPE